MESLASDIRTFARRVKGLREEKGYTQAHLAEILQVKKQTISNYESGEREPSYKVLIRAAKHFETTTDYLLGVSYIRSIENANDLSDALLGHHENANAYTQMLTKMQELQYCFDTAHENIGDINIEEFESEELDEKLESQYLKTSHRSRLLLDNILTQVRELYDLEIKTIEEAIESKKFEHSEWEDDQNRMDRD